MTCRYLRGSSGPVGRPWVAIAAVRRGGRIIVSATLVRSPCCPACGSMPTVSVLLLLFDGKRWTRWFASCMLGLPPALLDCVPAQPAPRAPTLEPAAWQASRRAACSCLDPCASCLHYMSLTCRWRLTRGPALSAPRSCSACRCSRTRRSRCAASNLFFITCAKQLGRDEGMCGGAHCSRKRRWRCAAANICSLFHGSWAG